MIEENKNLFYFVYPSWAKHVWAWDKLDAIFRDPFGVGELKNEPYYKKIGYHLAPESYALLPGPVGNGIIRGASSHEDWRKDRYYWVALLGHGKDYDGVDFSQIPGFGDNAKYDVYWLEEKYSDEHKLGLKKRFPTFLPKITLDYADISDSVVYISLAFRALSTGNVDDEACLRFQMRCHVFGLKCRPLDLTKDSLPEAAAKMVSPKISHRWHIVERGQDDLGLFIAKMFYLGCAAKQEANRLFQFVHLVGAFEGNPSMSRKVLYSTGVRVYGNI